jgi:hypothetical protein
LFGFLSSKGCRGEGRYCRYGQNVEVFRFKINFHTFQHYAKVNVHNTTVHTNVLFRNRPSHSSKNRWIYHIHLNLL